MSELKNSELGGVPKVIIVSQRLDIGGTEKHISRILPELRRRGIDVSLFLLERGGKLESALSDTGISIAGSKFMRSKLRRVLRAEWDLYRHLRRQRPDVVHFFLPESYLIGSIASMLAGVRVRVMSRRSLANYQIKHPILLPFEKWLHGHTNVLLGNSRAVIDELAQECRDRTKIGLIYNGIEISTQIHSDARAQSRRSLGLSDDCFVLTIIANLIGYKGHEDLLQGLALVRDRLPPGWRLLIVGRDDGSGASLKKQASALGLADNILWIGEHLSIDHFFNAADVALLCSHEEGFSNSLIEAMGFGLPVIATAVGGNLDAVIPGETGLLVPAKAPAALAAAIVNLAADPELRSRLGAAAKRRVENLFSLDACVQRYVNLYRGVADANHVTVQSIIDTPIKGRRLEDESYSKPKNRRILHVVPDLGIGGAERVLTQMLTAKGEWANEAVVACLLPGGFYIDQLRAAGIKVAVFNCNNVTGIISSLFEIVRLISSLKPSIVQGWMYYGDFAALVAVLMSHRRKKTRVIWTIRCSNMDLRQYRRRLWGTVQACRIFSSFPDLVIANSTAGIKAHLAIGYRPRRTEIIANGIDVEQFRPDAVSRAAVRNELGISEDVIVIAHVARVDPMKDHHNFIAAMTELPDYRALLIGAGTEELSIANVQSLGVCIDMPRFLAAADFVVSSSAFGEGFSNVIAEGMACGLPAVSTDVGDATLIIGDTGLVVPPQDPHALAVAIRTLASEPLTQKAERSARARARIVENFSLELAVERFAALYRSMTNLNS